MGKTARSRPFGSRPFTAVVCPADAGLSRLLRSSMSGRFHLDRLIGALAGAASPDDPQTNAELDPDDARHVAQHLAGVLARAREAGDPAADLLAGVARQLGVHEPSPEPAPAPPPAPAPAGEA